MCQTDPVTANCCQQEAVAYACKVVKLSTKYWLSMILLHIIIHLKSTIMQLACSHYVA